LCTRTVGSARSGSRAPAPCARCKPCSLHVRQSGRFQLARCKLAAIMLLHLAALAATVLILSKVVPGVRIRSASTAVLVAVVFSLLNFFLGWLIRVLLFVPALLTLGILFLFMSFIVNTVMLWLTDKMMASFEISTRRALLLSSAAITVVNAGFHLLSICCQSAARGQLGGPRWI